MKRALVGSLVIHALFGVGLLSFEMREGDVVSHTRAVAIEIVAPPTIAPPPPTPPTDVQGGGAAFASASESSAKQIAAAPRKTRSKQRSSVEPTPFGEYTIDRSGTGAADGGVSSDGEGGEGTGTGGNRGSGIGFGDGGKIVVAEEQIVLPPPAERAVSKARPAKLIYPTRNRDLGEDALFIAQITVDTDGYVVGAKLVRGLSGPRDSEAADLIFRFRYLPALDDAGHAIRSTFEQPFHVNR